MSEMSEDYEMSSKLCSNINLPFGASNVKVRLSKRAAALIGWLGFTLSQLSDDFWESCCESLPFLLVQLR